MESAVTDGLSPWRDHLAELAFDCASATVDEQAGLVLQMRALMNGAPGEWGRRFADMPAAAALAALCEAGGATSAALALIEGRAGYMLSQAPEGAAMATVVFDGVTGEASAEGDSVALALIGALAACLAGPALRLEGAALHGAAPSLRLN